MRFVSMPGMQRQAPGVFTQNAVLSSAVVSFTRERRSSTTSSCCEALAVRTGGPHGFGGASGTPSIGKSLVEREPQLVVQDGDEELRV